MLTARVRDEGLRRITSITGWVGDRVPRPRPQAPGGAPGSIGAAAGASAWIGVASGS